MTHMKISNLLLSLCALSLVSACGGPLVEFDLNADASVKRDSGLEVPQAPEIGVRREEPGA